MEFPALDVGDWTKRAPELREAFQSEMYGGLPVTETLEALHSVPLDEDVSGTLVLRPFVSRTGCRFDVMHAAPHEPARATFVGINFVGNHAVVAAPNVPEPREWAYPDGALWPVFRGCNRDRWCVEEILRAGFGLATFCHSDVVSDDPTLAAPILESLGEGRPLGAIAAWAWGLLSVAQSITPVPPLPSRGEGPGVRGSKISSNRGESVATRRSAEPTLGGPVIFVGHSRMGKAALLAGAMGAKPVACIQSGCGGAAPSRTQMGETVGQITRAFPHWFTQTFADYAGREDALPFDQHALIALCAPHPVLLLNADEDEWANPSGQEAMAELARPIFASLGAEGDLEAFRRAGVHSVTPEDWSGILRFFKDRV